MKIITLLKIKSRPRRDPKSVTSKNKIKTRLQALVCSFERFKYVFQYKWRVVRVGGRVYGDQKGLSILLKFGCSN